MKTRKMPIVPPKETSWDGRVRINMDLLVQKPSYCAQVYFESLQCDPEEQEKLVDILCEIHRKAKKSPDADTLSWPDLYTQVIMSLMSFKPTTSKSSNNFRFCLNLCLFENVSFKSDLSAIVAPLVNNNYLSEDDAVLFSEKLFFGINPSKPDGKRVRWNGQIEGLVTWLICCWLTNSLRLSGKYFKMHVKKERKKESLAWTQKSCTLDTEDTKDAYFNEDTSLFWRLITNHFDTNVSKSTVHRYIDKIFTYLSNKKKQNSACNNGLICPIKKTFYVIWGKNHLSYLG